MLDDAVVPAGGVILGMTPFTVGLAVWGLGVDATTAVDAGAVACIGPTDGRRISFPGKFTEICEVAAGVGDEGAEEIDGRMISVWRGLMEAEGVVGVGPGMGIGEMAGRRMSLREGVTVEGVGSSDDLGTATAETWPMMGPDPGCQSTGSPLPMPIGSQTVLIPFPCCQRSTPVSPCVAIT